MRAAAFLWMTPLLAARSMWDIAVLAAWSAVSVPAALMADLTRVRSSDRTALLRSRRFSFWRLRLIWLAMLATVRRTLGERRREGKATPGLSGSHQPARSEGRTETGTVNCAMDLGKIRNLSIIAHIDHGKSTLADRMLELTGAVDAREMRDQYLDSMDLERERGITIKLQSVRLNWRDHVVNLIDTPGHVDFGYEVSRSLAACEGVILVVDAAQGIEAQTLANCYLALENNLEIVAVLNKIDLPAAEPDRCAAEIENVLGIPAEEILRISAKTGEGVAELLDAVIERIPPPVGGSGCTVAGPDLRLSFRQLPRCHQLDSRCQRHDHERVEGSLHAGWLDPRDR